MPTQKKLKTDQDLDCVAQQFLKDHPEAKEALGIFGIAYDRYRQYLAAQSSPIFYTSTSTIPGERHGKLD